MEETGKLEWGRDLPGELAEKWPKTESGEFEPVAHLADCTQLNMDAGITVNMLDAFGIPCLVAYPHYGGFGRLIMGMSAEGVSLYVPESRLEDAKALLEGGTEDEED